MFDRLKYDWHVPRATRRKVEEGIGAYLDEFDAYVQSTPLAVHIDERKARLIRTFARADAMDLGLDMFRIDDRGPQCTYGFLVYPYTDDAGSHAAIEGSIAWDVKAMTPGRLAFWDNDAHVSLATVPRGASLEDLPFVERGSVRQYGNQFILLHKLTPRITSRLEFTPIGDGPRGTLYLAGTPQTWLD